MNYVRLIRHDVTAEELETGEVMEERIMLSAEPRRVRVLPMENRVCVLFKDEAISPMNILYDPATWEVWLDL